MVSREHSTEQGRADGAATLEPGPTEDRLPHDRPRGPTTPAATYGQPCQPESAVADCRFLCDCGTYNDPLVARSAKGQRGHGCIAQTDAYRKKHCRAFACRLLCIVLREAVAKLIQQQAEQTEATSHDSTGRRHPA